MKGAVPCESKIVDLGDLKAGRQNSIWFHKTNNLVLCLISFETIIFIIVIAINEFWY